MKGIGFVVLMVAASARLLGAQAVPEPPRAFSSTDELPSAFHCPVDGLPVGDATYSVEFNGRRYYMESEMCRQKFLEDPERFARALEPRAALFSSPDASRVPYGPGFLYFGVFVVLGLVTGALASYLAVQKGLPALPWFALGFATSVVGVALVLVREGEKLPFSRDGLTKMPSTHAPTKCPSCGRGNHPSATSCSHCASALAGGVESDVARL